jgi:hypothetical protein
MLTPRYTAKGRRLRPGISQRACVLELNIQVTRLLTACAAVRLTALLKLLEALGTGHYATGHDKHDSGA